MTVLEFAVVVLRGIKHFATLLEKAIQQAEENKQK